MSRPIENTEALPRIVSGKRRVWLALLIVIGVVQTGTLLGTAWGTQWVLDPVLSEGATIRRSGLTLLVTLAIIGIACRWFERTAAERLGNHYVHLVRLALYDAITRRQPNRGGGAGVNMIRFTSDLSAIRQWVALGIARSISASLFLFGVLLALWMLHPPIGQYTAYLLIGAAAVIVLIGIGVEKRVRQARRKRGRLANLVADTLRQIREISAFGRVARERRRLARHSEALNTSLQSRARWLGALTAFTDLVHRILMIIVVVVGAQALQNDEVTVATLLTLCAVAALLGGPLRELARVYEYRKNFTISRSKLTPVLAHLPNRSRVKPLPKGNGALALKSISLTRGGATNELRVDPGNRIALLGGNGSGKSTLLSVLAGLESAARGHVFLDGVDTRHLPTGDRSTSVGMASHRGALATGSISKNIRYRCPSASAAAVHAAICAAGLEDWLKSQPEGLSTRLFGPTGGVSEGEAARIKLARAVLGTPRLLLLDEIEAGLDSEGRRALNALFNIYPGTIVYATHDLALAHLADQQWRLHRGVIHTSPHHVRNSSRTPPSQEHAFDG
ncbi:MAG: ABC transporter ATP-binding protein [Pseudomonadota bacterium]